MWHFSFFSFSFCFLLFFFLVPHQNGSPVGTISADLLNQTCKKCADESTIFSYNFCLTSLQAIPVSHATNLQGLAIVAMELALENATNTVSTIKELLNGGGAFDPFSIACLEGCLEIYLDVVSRLVNSIGVFLSENYDTADAWVSAVMDETATCEGGFKGEEGAIVPSPLTKENYNLFQLCDIALCIIHLLTLIPQAPLQVGCVAP
ncbi:hypothetical protein L1049_027177 [Liquidambar formosana]|uniref:Pectinesterase inhibitor domain-containing protein n=1 Tax=Liquidambar formosana TaxID=63359 RepID=A0AAP0N6I1_LIQFO